MEVYATNDLGSVNLPHQDLIHDNPMFYDILVDLTGDSDLPGIEIFKDNKKGIYTARFKTHGYGIVITSDGGMDTHNPGYMYAIAKPLFTNPQDDDIIKLVEGALSYDTVYILKDALIELFIIK